MRTRRISFLDECMSVSEPSSTNGFRINAMKNALREVMENGLTEQQKKYVNGYYLCGKTMEQLACENGVNKSTVSRTLCRARKKIHSSIKYYCA